MEPVWAAWRRWLGSPARDAVLAVVTAVVLVWGSYGEGHPHQAADQVQFGKLPVPHPTAPALGLVAIACLALAGRRRWPLAVLAVSTAAAAGYTLLGYVNGAVLVAPAMALYAVAAQLSVRRAVLAAVATLAVLLTVTSAANPFGTITSGAFDVLPGLIGAALFGGIAVASRRAYIASIEARSADEARRRVDEERLRIARELHDIVAHTMATINVQAGAAAHVLPERPEAAADALQAIKAASKDGLRELRAILGLLRQADQDDPTQPAPGLGQLDALIAGTCGAGVATTLHVAGSPRPLPPAADLAAYRIVQESLTNVIRHAGPATASVWLRYGDRDLRIDITDTGRGRSGAPQETRGHGLAGMRERAAAVGGDLQTGPAGPSGFRVSARLPLAGQPDPADQPGAAGPAPRPSGRRPRSRPGPAPGAPERTAAAAAPAPAPGEAAAP